MADDDNNTMNVDDDDQKGPPDDDDVDVDVDDPNADDNADDDDFGDDDDDFGDDDDDFGDDDDDDDGFGDDADDWGDAVVDDGFTIKHDPAQLAADKKKALEEKENLALKNQDWTCLECKHKNKGMGLLCLNCNKPNLGELDRQRRKRELKEAEFWATIFAEIYLPLESNRKSGTALDRDLAEKHLRDIFTHEMVERRIPDLKKYTNNDLHQTCDACTQDFDQKTTPRMELNCHGNICKICCRNWIQAKIDDENIIPFIRCPAHDCDYAIPAYMYFDDKVGLTDKQLYKLITIYCEKQLVRNSNWVNCTNQKGKCKYGILLQLSESEKQYQCDNCGTKQKAKRKTEFDEGFNAMLKSGKIRLCPKCKFAHMKDRGLCNVLQCGKCKIWWNWRTREMNNTEKGLKAIARSKGALWEPGELEYQMKLQRDDPMAFKHLLESNGVKYDPNYVRGSGK